MKIGSYAISAQAEHRSVNISYSSARYVMTRQTPSSAVTAKKDSDGSRNSQGNADKDAETEQGAVAEISEGAKRLAAGLKKGSSWAEMSQSLRLKRSMAISQTKNVTHSVEDTKISLLEQMISQLTGKKFKFARVELDQQSSRGQEPPALDEQMQGCIQVLGNQGGQGDQRTLTSYTLERESYVYDAEYMTYEAQGIVNTEDGQSIEVNVNLNMGRRYESYDYSSEQVMKMSCDPLVVNYGGSAASLTGETYDFDLDLDGQADQIHFAGSGSGFLALDRNGDGVINDGSELFGPQTGSGFSELRQYDLDGNGWIDENDDVYGSLRVWSKDADGNDQLFTLKEVDVGAIYLGETASDYTIKDVETNEELGSIRSTSIFLKDSGGAGTISHIDLAI